MNPESEQDQEIFQIWKDYGMEGNFDVCRTAYSGWYPNVGEFGYEIMSNLYDIPEYLEPYIDYAKFGKDLIRGGDYWESSGHYFDNHI